MVGALILMFVVTPLLNLVDDTALEYSPFGAAVALAGDPKTSLSWGGAALVVAAWTAAVLLAAIVAEQRRDLA